MIYPNCARCGHPYRDHLVEPGDLGSGASSRCELYIGPEDSGERSVFDALRAVYTALKPFDSPLRRRIVRATQELLEGTDDAERWLASIEDEEVPVND